jgi:hypothetical protein
VFGNLQNNNPRNAGQGATLIMARSRSIDNPMPPEGCWIKYQLELRNIKFEVIAKKAKCTVATVSRVISRERHSERVEAVLAETLGYQSYKHLWADAFISSERKVV